MTGPHRHVAFRQELLCLKWSKGREKPRQGETETETDWQMEWEAPVIHSMSKSLVMVRGGKKRTSISPRRTVALLFSCSLFQPHVVCMLMRWGVNVWTSAPHISICNNKGEWHGITLDGSACRANNCGKKGTLLAECMLRLLWPYCTAI